MRNSRPEIPEGGPRSVDERFEGSRTVRELIEDPRTPGDVLHRVWKLKQRMRSRQRWQATDYTALASHPNLSDVTMREMVEDGATAFARVVSQRSDCPLELRHDFVPPREGPPPTDACPRCEYITLHGRGGYEICPVCFWEDCGVRELDVVSGPNHMTLRVGRTRFAQLGAVEYRFRRHVRPPFPDEIPNPHLRR